MTTAEEVNSIIGVINKLLNAEMKKLIRKSMPDVNELLSSKFLDSDKGTLKLKKKKKKKKKKTTKKRGGSPILSLFGSKKSKTLDDVSAKIKSGEKLTSHDANILAMTTDKLAAITLMNLIMVPESDIPGSEEVIKIYNGFLKAQEKTLTEFGRIDKEKKAQLKAEIEEKEQTNFDKRVRDQALTIFESSFSQLDNVTSIVETHGKNIEDAKRRNNFIKKAAFAWFALMSFFTIYCFFQFMYNLDNAMARAQEWLSSFQYVCTSGPTFFERVAGVTGELRDCKEGLSTPVIGSLVNTISDMITSVAFTAGDAVGMGRLLLFICALLQFTAGPLSLGFTGYYSIMSRVRTDDREEMLAFKESVETQGVIMRQQKEFLKDSGVTTKQLAKFVANEYSDNKRDRRASQSRPSRGLQGLIDHKPEPVSVEEIKEPIEEGALRKTSRRKARERIRKIPITKLRRRRRTTRRTRTRGTRTRRTRRTRTRRTRRTM
jgi:hypothetical protein